MRHNYTLSLKNTVVVHEHGDDLLLTGHEARAVRLFKPNNALKCLLSKLKAGGMTADQLCESVIQEDASVDLAKLYYVIDSLEKKSFICYTLDIGGKNLVTLEPISPKFAIEQASIDVQYRLSRFACLRRLDDKILLESPLGYAILRIHESLIGAAIALLAIPHSAMELTGRLPELDVTHAGALLSLLCSSGAAFACRIDGNIAEDNYAALQQWEFHDLFYHSRSRAGRHEYPLGSNFRFLDSLPALPAVKPPMSERRFALYKPDIAALELGDLPFSKVSESRRSIYSQAEQAISVVQLGEFLYRSARIKAVIPADPAHGVHYESSKRLCPSGGAIHGLELYLTISRCDGIAPGFYHFDPQDHLLEHLSDLDELHQTLLGDASRATGIQSQPDILITLAARFGRTSWKYQSLAYALILKDTGALYQQMYLVATAMNLAPRGLGGGNSDLFAKAAGLDYYAETSVGEFLLSGKTSYSKQA
jgi:SagB-type dehydrogenase family enzyme